MEYPSGFSAVFPLSPKLNGSPLASGPLASESTTASMNRGYAQPTLKNDHSNPFRRGFLISQTNYRGV
ncbi:unnamed protein product [Coregonus sp. 'balchen']|nr:unnamed protein product [Coregonus sp. 'balchen']